jgi:hypothetical protein
MPAQHTIDDDGKLITTTWSGAATEHEMIDALVKYQQDIKSQPRYQAYDEIVDFSEAGDFSLSAEGIMKLAQTAAKSDIQGVRTKLAIVVKISFAYGLGRMYEIYRSLIPNVHKDVRVFKNHADALVWIQGVPGP